MPTPSLTELEIAGFHRGSERCEACGYALDGQPVRRDPVYGLDLVQCPECGAARVIPGNKTGSGRTRSTLSARVLLAILVVAGIGALTGGLAQSTGFAASVPVARSIAERVGGPSIVFHRIENQIWRAERARVLSEIAAAGVGYDTVVLTDLLWLVPLVPLAACAVVLCLPRLSRRGLVIAGFLPLLPASLALAGYYAASNSSFGYEYAITLAEWEGGARYGVLAMAVAWVYTPLCFAFARPLTRRILALVGGERVRSGRWAALWLDATRQ